MDKKWKALLLMAMTFAAAVCFKNDFLRFLLGFEVMVVLLCLAEVRFLKGKAQVMLSLPETIRYKEEGFSVLVQAASTSWIPMPRLQVQVGVTDRWASREMVCTGTFMLDSKEEASLQFSFDSEFCGVYEAKIRNLRIWDHLGVFCVKSPVTDHARTLYILPPSAGEQVFEGLPGREEAEGEQAEFRRGVSSVDTSDIRTYRVGDSLRHIHWKLTAKLDELLVREMGEPQERMTRLYLNLQHRERELSRETWDHFVDRVAALSRMMLSGGYPHYVCWIDIEIRKMLEFRVTDTASLQEMLCGLLHAITWTEGEAAQVLEDVRWHETMEEYIEIDLKGEIVPSGAEG